MSKQMNEADKQWGDYNHLSIEQMRNGDFGGYRCFCQLKSVAKSGVKV